MPALPAAGLLPDPYYSWARSLAAVPEHLAAAGDRPPAGSWRCVTCPRIQERARRVERGSRRSSSCKVVDACTSPLRPRSTLALAGFTLGSTRSSTTLSSRRRRHWQGAQAASESPPSRCTAMETSQLSGRSSTRIKGEGESFAFAGLRTNTQWVGDSRLRACGQIHVHRRRYYMQPVGGACDGSFALVSLGIDTPVGGACENGYTCLGL